MKFLNSVLVKVLYNVNSNSMQPMYSTKTCVYVSLAIILWKCYLIVAARATIGVTINVCENVADFLFIQDIEDCSKYFACVNGEAKAQQCRAGLYFDAIQQACIGSPLNCLQCPSGRMMNVPLPKTCDKYISCYYGKALLRQCKSNEQFNATAGKCDLASNVDCVENRCSIYESEKDFIYIPSAASCKNYYICQEGKAKLLTCSNGLHFSKECNCCDKAENVQCVAKDSRSVMESSKYSNLIYTPTLVAQTNKIKCPLKGQFLYKFIDDSHYYITCVNGKASIYACAADSHFDDKLKRCVSVVPEKEDPPNMINTEFDVSTCPQFGAQIFPHVKRTKYILCVNGEITVFDCPAFHYFDTGSNVCRTSSEPQEQHVVSFAAEYDVVSTDVKCPIKGNITLPHTEKTLYYLCIDGKATVIKCAPNLYYDANVKSCTKIITPISTDSEISCPKFGTLKFPHSNETKFQLCINGTMYILTCGSNEIFDSDINNCRMDDKWELEDHNNSDMTQNSVVQLSTAASSGIVCPKFGTYMFPNVQTNHYYYVCVDGDAIGFTCGEGYILDIKTNSCRNELDSVA